MSAKFVSTRTEKRLQLMFDSLTSAICAAVGFVCFRSAADIAVSGFAVLNIMSVLQIMGFLFAFEQYAHSASKLQERSVCVFLSCLYSIILSLLENWIFFGSAWLLKVQLLSGAVTMAAMLLVNRWLYSFLHSNRFRKQRLLVLAGEGNDHFRMKRLKYGTLSEFDSWYEALDPDNEEMLENLLQSQMEEYDAICIFDNLKDEVYERIVKRAMLLNKEVYAIPKVIDINRNQANYVRFDDILAFHIQKYELSQIELALKRVFDLAVSSVCLLIAAIPMIAIAIAIKVTSPGPVFYKQLRYTRNKKEFYVYKFRTMVPDAEKLTGPTFAQKHDPRITPIGHFLRACRLDELPQLLNIIKGDMSVVGPRPERPFFVEKFEQEIENYNYRFMVKAGLTSLSHVYGRYSTYIHDRTCYDLLYISNYSILLDLKIILLTTKTLLMKEAAEGEDEYKQASKQKKEDIAK